MAKIIRLTESDLEKIVKKVISEQSKKNISEQWLKKLLGTAERDLLARFETQAVKNVEQLFQKALSNSKNIIMSPEGAITLVSTRGTKIPYEDIQALFLNLSNGSISVEKAQKFLPNDLPTIPDFRKKFFDLMSSAEKKSTTTTSAKVGGTTNKVTNDMSNARKMSHGGYAGSN